MADYLFSNSVNIRLPSQPSTTDPELYNELSIIYNAIRQLQVGLDNVLDTISNPQVVDYTINLTDRGRCIDTNSDVTIPKDDSIPFPPGSTVGIANTTNVSIQIIPATDVSLVVAGTGTTGTRTLAGYGMATIRYMGNNIWYIIGAGVS